MSVLTTQDINAKCRGMYSKLLSRADYDALLSAGSVSRITEYLKKETQYAYVLRRFDVNNVHRGQLEQVFKRSLFYDYERLIAFSSGSYKTALKTVFETFEIDDLKLVISSICSEHEHLLTADDLTYVRHYGSFTPAALLAAATIKQLADMLHGSRYHELLLPFADDETPDFLAIDHALNSLKHGSLMAAFKKSLSGNGREVAMSIYGAQADLEDISFIYRTKKLYRFQSGVIVPNLSFVCHRINRHTLIELATCSNFDAFVSLVGKTKYASLFPAGRQYEWEKYRSYYFYKMQKRNLRRQGGNVGVALAYLYLKENDIKNIIIIVEGIRYRIPQEEIATLLTI